MRRTAAHPNPAKQRRSPPEPCRAALHTLQRPPAAAPVAPARALGRGARAHRRSPASPPPPHRRPTAAPFASQVAEAARAAGIKRIWYASSACIYPESKQTDENLGGASGLKEDDAWPAQPQDAYGLEKLMTEELLMHYDADFGMEVNTPSPCHTPPPYHPLTVPHPLTASTT